MNATIPTMTPSIAARLGVWIAGRDTGASSTTMAAVMMGADPKAIDRSYPHDPADLGRCLRLLDAIPEWKPHLGCLAGIGPVWAVLVERWDELAALMDEEVGIDWSKGKKAGKTYAAMQALIVAARAEARAPR